jgi:hypothetical protein
VVIIGITFPPVSVFCSKQNPNRVPYASKSDSSPSDPQVDLVRIACKQENLPLSKALLPLCELLALVLPQLIVCGHRLIFLLRFTKLGCVARKDVIAIFRGYVAREAGFVQRLVARLPVLEVSEPEPPVSATQ